MHAGIAFSMKHVMLLQNSAKSSFKATHLGVLAPLRLLCDVFICCVLLGSEMENFWIYPSDRTRKGEFSGACPWWTRHSAVPSEAYPWSLKYDSDAPGCDFHRK